MVRAKRARTRVAALLVLFSAAAAGGISACGLILGLESPVDPPPDAGTDATGDVAVDVGDDAEPPCVHTSTESADDAVAIFVAAAPVGEDTPTCGDRITPCATIAHAQARAQVFERKRILIARGTYRESVTASSGFTFEGGWDVLGTSWIRTCVEPRYAAVVIEAPETETTTLTATDLAEEVTLRALTLRSKAVAGPGESLYGIAARGASTSVVLDGVAVEVAAGGDGVTGNVGPEGDAGLVGCSTGDAGVGEDGELGLGADAGVFTVDGYQPASAGSGVDGTAGESGGPPGAGPCIACIKCIGGLACDKSSDGTSCGGPGKPGCGGAGGVGGGPGHGGGASIGVFLWDARVSAIGGVIRVGAGGLGGGGGAGGAGGRGSLGDRGDPGRLCNVDCNGLLLTCGEITRATGPGGDAGAPGGRGGRGGQGGGGSGGPSFAIVRGGDAQITVSEATTLEHGDAGVSLGNGSPGMAGALYP